MAFKNRGQQLDGKINRFYMVAGWESELRQSVRINPELDGLAQGY